MERARRSRRRWAILLRRGATRWVCTHDGGRVAQLSKAVLFRRRLLGTTSMAALGLKLAASTSARTADDWTGAGSTDWFATGN